MAWHRTGAWRWRLLAHNACVRQRSLHVQLLETPAPAELSLYMIHSMIVLPSCPSPLLSGPARLDPLPRHV